MDDLTTISAVIVSISVVLLGFLPAPKGNLLYRVLHAVLLLLAKGYDKIKKDSNLDKGDRK